MKVIIQIPCYNEAETLKATLEDLPRKLEGVDVVEWLVIDDGSTDDTSAVARGCGVDHVVSIPRNRGLASAFSTGLAACLECGADVIVNTDADNQYSAADIPKLVAPILQGRAEMVIGERDIAGIEHFSFLKKCLQKLGSSVVRSLSHTDVGDAPSGFRAISRSAASRLNVFSEYTYTLETIIQAGQNGISIVSVPIRINGKTRPSRLVKSIPSYVKRSVLTMFRIFLIYRPMRVFLLMASICGFFGLLLGLRFLFFFLTGDGAGHVQSLILTALLLGSSLGFFVLALLADLIAVNRRLLEKTNWRLGQIEERLAQFESNHIGADRS
ncbi:glycosyltransferase family 2 protein [Pelagicoccus sp. SDUM812002]|uniref:glycosyltransferase family 2 protein n=1 Tax=Pelagicoccus sp. SDUM812002 TaxID=3041266 RepID=UPI00280D858F|nr:glycosyltransferase family 2 protein [Pelagicoccus sp. SDUM812002]MDQ8186382.1 glycosyltransferase family 2 protein [Pelagicoccus sp. SDUM812002]